MALKFGASQSKTICSGGHVTARTLCEPGRYKYCSFSNFNHLRFGCLTFTSYAVYLRIYRHHTVPISHAWIGLFVSLCIQYSVWDGFVLCTGNDKPTEYIFKLQLLMLFRLISGCLSWQDEIIIRVSQ